jgi:hypothetical protein
MLYVTSPSLPVTVIPPSPVSHALGAILEPRFSSLSKRNTSDDKDITQPFGKLIFSAKTEFQEPLLVTIYVARILIFVTCMQITQENKL